MTLEEKNNYKILFVDDEHDITEFLSYNFKKFGFDVRHAANGMEGKSVVESWMPDIIVADILMPELNGIGFCREIKKTKRQKIFPWYF